MTKENKTENIAIRKYTITFLCVAILFYILTDYPWFDVVRQPVLQFFAAISSGLLSFIGYGTSATGDVVSSSKFSVSIKEGCDALAPIILYTIATAIYPVALAKRLKGIAYGILALVMLNVIRICSLFIIGIHLPTWFDFMHVDFWQVLFIILTAITWILWMNWARPNRITTSE